MAEDLNDDKCTAENQVFGEKNDYSTFLDFGTRQDMTLTYDLHYVGYCRKFLARPTGNVATSILHYLCDNHIMPGLSGMRVDAQSRNDINFSPPFCSWIFCAIFVFLDEPQPQTCKRNGH